LRTAIKAHVVAVLLAALASRAPAQSGSASGYPPFWQRTLHVGLDAGTSVPTGDFGQAFNPWFDVGANAAWAFTHHGGVWLQADVNYASAMPVNAVTIGYGASSGFGSITSGTLNIVLNKRDYFGNFTPYLLLGGGGYVRSVTFDRYTGGSYCNTFVGLCGAYGAMATRSRTQFVAGGDAGGGFRYRTPLPLRLFIEARYNTIATRHGDTGFIPVVIGAEY
jgi:hypothetical protein